MGLPAPKIDIKAGSDTSLTKILGNRLWGFRRTDTDCAGSGSTGDAIVVQVAARNIKIENNIIGEAPVGIKEKYFPVGWPTSLSRRVKINRNYLYNIQKYHPLDAGAAFDLAGDVRVVSNVMAQGDYVCDQGPDSGYRPAGPTFSGNLRIAVEIRDPASVDTYPCPYDASVNWTRDENEAKTYLYERKRWTGPEFHAVPRGY